MFYLEGLEFEKGMKFMDEASIIARNSLCARKKCGAIIEKNGEIIGRGYNAPPLDDKVNAKCDFGGDYNKKPKYDLTCCVHAEWRAILDALKNNSNKINSSTLYFMRIDDNNEKTKASDPFCTVCSRLALDVGIGKFVLFREEGIAVYDTNEYNDLSYNYYKN